MTKFYAAQVVMLLGCILMITSGVPKKKSTILRIQNLQLSLMTIGNGLLGSMSGAITNIFGLARNYIQLSGRMTRKLQIALVLANVVCVIPLNNLGWVGYLPLLATCLFTIVVNCKNIITYKCVFIVTCILWLVHDIVIKAYTTIPFDLFGIIANIVSIFQTMRSSRTTV